MIIEVTLRSFYTCKYGTVSPSITFQVEDPSSPLDISRHLKELGDMISAAPGEPELRPMTQSEVDAYLEEETLDDA